MSFKDTQTNWKFTMPQSGEVDSAEGVQERMREVDTAILSPMERKVLTGNGERIVPNSLVGEAEYSKSPDPYWTEQMGRNVYTTTEHFHPTPKKVPYAEKAMKADKATQADKASKADALSSPFKINGKQTDGRTDVTIGVNDISDAPRVGYGTAVPTATNTGISLPLRKGDIYVRITR